MERHVRLLRILVGLWGGLAMLVGVSMLLLAAGAWTEFRQSLGTGVEFAAGLTTLVFAGIGAFASDTPWVPCLRCFGVAPMRGRPHC